VVQDRYGPPRPKPLVVASLGATPAAEPYRVPMLGWSGKPPAAPERAALAPQTPAPAPHKAPPAQPSRSPPRTIGPEAAAAPAFAQPRPSHPTARIAAAPAPPPRGAGAAPRFYSLHREYGMAPDAIPEQSVQPRYVLIGPPDAPTPGDDDKAPVSKPKTVF
jgi:hypothetical protein